MNPISLFPNLWHRRAASITLIGTAIELGLLGYLFSAGTNSGLALAAAAGMAGASILFSLLAVLPLPERPASWFSFIGFILGIGASGLALMTPVSENVHTVFVLVLSILSLVAGLYGPAAWLILVIVVTPYAASYFSATPRNLSDTLTFGLFYALPVLASWLLWHGGSHRSGGGVAGANDTAYSTLAEQLNQVANESDIVIGTIADGVLALSSKGEIKLINPSAEKTLGWSKRDSLGLDYRSIIKLTDAQGNSLPEDADPIFVALHIAKPIERSDLSLTTNSGKTFLARLSITPVGQVGDGVIIVFRDITAEKAEEREQAEFISTASHEMRTPVAAIEGYLGLALNPNTAAIDDKARLYLGKAHESAQHLGRLFQDLLDVSKADDGRIRNLPGIIDLVAFTADIVTSLTPKATDKNLTLTFAPVNEVVASERRLTPVYFADVDGDHLREVLNNLVENAIKYTKTGSVTVNVAGDNANVLLSIRDSGIGIPREDIAHLFQKFYRVDNSDTREIGGTGLGLYLSRRLVEIMGGKIWVESDYGHGSVFTVSLPRVDFETAQARLRALAEQRERQAANQAAKV